MTKDNVALEADGGGRIEQAADFYEELLQTGEAEIEQILNLAVLYWQSTEYGFNAANHLTAEFIARASRRYPEILCLAQQRYPSHPGGQFWQMYTKWADLGGEMPDSECLAMLKRNPSYLEPLLGLKQLDRVSAQILLEQCKKPQTVRSRYVSSVVSSRLAVET